MKNYAQSAEPRADVSYDVLIRQHGSKYHLYIAELRLWASAETLEEAHRDIQEKVVARIGSYIDAGAAHEIPCPDRLARKRRLHEGTRIFAIRAAIITACCAFLIAVAISLLTAYLSPLRSILALSDSMLRNAQTSAGTGRILEAIANNLESTPVEQRQKALNDLRRIVQVLQPFATELRPLLVDQPSGEPKQ